LPARGPTRSALLVSFFGTKLSPLIRAHTKIGDET
jgi:hypothetical protein